MTKLRRKKFDKKKIHKECWNLDSSFFIWIENHLKVFYLDSKKIIDLSWHKFSYKGEEITLEEALKRMLILLSYINHTDWLDGKQYEDAVNDFMDLFKLTIHYLWW